MLCHRVGGLIYYTYMLIHSYTLKLNCTYDFLQFIYKHSNNRMLNHSGMSHNVAEHCHVEKLEQATDNLSDSQETFVEE